MASREGSKYGHLVKEIHIQDRVGIFDKYAVMDGEFFGWDAISIRYGLVGRTGCITEETDKLHTHDYDQLIWLVSADPYDMLELGAELEVVMGLNGERHRIATPTALHIPAGTPHTSPIVTRATAMTMPGGVYHLPLEFKRVDRPLIFISLSANAMFSAKSQTART